VGCRREPSSSRGWSLVTIASVLLVADAADANRRQRLGPSPSCRSRNPSSLDTFRFER
ncbi:hypothetical protein U1Q18_000914, partial [Sarracenia purpurea var. burkii]